MSFEELLEQIGKIPCQEKRAREKDYCEVVVEKTNLAAMNEVLKAYFGSALKPEGEEPTPEASQYAKPHGGIYNNQTLYYHQGSHSVALLWPWGSGQSVTLKIIRNSS